MFIYFFYLTPVTSKITGFLKGLFLKRKDSQLFKGNTQMSLLITKEVKDKMSIRSLAMKCKYEIYCNHVGGFSIIALNFVIR